MIARAISPILFDCPYDVRRPATWVLVNVYGSGSQVTANPSVTIGKPATDARLNGGGQLVALADLAWDWGLDSDRGAVMERRGAHPVRLVTILNQAHDHPVQIHRHPEDCE